MSVLEPAVRKGRDGAGSATSPLPLLPTSAESLPQLGCFGGGEGGCATNSEGKGPDSGLLKQIRAVQPIPLPVGRTVLACC